MISKDTRVCISVASRPGNIGTRVHNAAYAALGLDFIYKAFGVEDIAGAIAGVRALGIRGVSVSMPFKESVIAHLDSLDETAQQIRSVNTVVNEPGGKLVGYNTDVSGARAALESLQARPGESVLLVGAGGAARAVLLALKQLGFGSVRVTNRTFDKLAELNAILPCAPVAWDSRQREFASLIINATSVGMNPDAEQGAVDEQFVRECRAVMDVVVSPVETRLIRCARAAGKATVPGSVMFLEQAMAQFTLYTGRPAPRCVMEQEILQLLG